MGHRTRLSENHDLHHKRALRQIIVSILLNFSRYSRVKIIRNNDVECNTKESPRGFNQGSVVVSRALNEFLRFTCSVKRRKPFKSLLSDMSYIIENIRLSELRPSGNLLHHPHPSLSTF